MSISMTRYVRITSAVIGASAVAQQKLTGRRFTTHPRVPVNEIIEVINGGAEQYFGANSNEAAFARQYFGYISPAPASQARDLQFAAYAPDGRVPTIFGARLSATLAQFNALGSGTIIIQLDENEATITVDVSGATSFSEIAATVQTALRAQTGTQFAQANVTFNSTSSAFTISGSIAESAVAKVSGGTLASLMNLTGVGSVASPGVSPQTPLDAFIAAEQVSDSFGSCAFEEQLDLADAIDVAEFVAARNVKYQFYPTVDRQNYSNYSAALIGIASTGLILNETDGEWKEALPMAIMAATDYTRRNAAVNRMYRQAGLTADVTGDMDANAMDKARVNYYGQTANAGQKIAFFQRGVLCGGVTAPLDMSVHANEQDLKGYLTSKFMDLQLTTNGIPVNDDGKAMALSVIADGVARGKRNGTILIQKALTNTNKIAIGQLTGDTNAWHDVQSEGVWRDVYFVEEVSESGVAEWTLKYTLCYAKGDMVRLIEGSHNLV